MEQNTNHQLNTNSNYFNTQTNTNKDCKILAAAKDPQLLYQHILSINTQAEFFFKRNDYQVSLNKLKQAQKILEYVAQSCKNIRKELIIVILNNLACLSQMLWDLTSTADYLQAIIYNYSINSLTKSEIKCNQSTLMISILSEQMGGSFEDDLKWAEYNLKYCAICSSLMKNKDGLVAARKSLKTFLFYLNNLQKQDKHLKSSEIKDHLFFAKVNAFKNCIQKKELFNKQSRRNDFLGMLYSLFKKECTKHQDSYLINYFNGLYLGDLMSLTFQTLQATDKKEIQSTPSYLFLLTTISYFSIATEIKNIDRNQYDSKHDYSYFYFMAVVSYLLLIPYQSPYLNFILQNYKAASGKSFTLINQPKVTIEQIDEYLKNRHEQGGMLPQQSVATPEIHRRKNLRLDQQNQKLKKIIENNGLNNKKQFVNMHSFDKKIKSLSTSRNQSKKHINNDRHLNTLRSNNTSRKYEVECKEQQKKTKKKNDKAKNLVNVQKNDDLGEKYFEMAFKKTNSPQALLQKRKQSGISKSSTKDHSISQKGTKLSSKKDRNMLSFKQLKIRK